MTMKSLLIVAHGSRRETSNEEVRKLAEQIRSMPDLPVDEVATAFLELAEPSIPEGLEACIQRGADEVLVFPYFLAAGRHVVEDIPAEIAPVQNKYPEISVSITPHLGLATELPALIAASTLKK
jgi:sirohydrochlorin ferrochelatase